MSALAKRTMVFTSHTGCMGSQPQEMRQQLLSTGEVAHLLGLRGSTWWTCAPEGSSRSYGSGGTDG